MVKTKILTPMDENFVDYLTKHGCYLPGYGNRVDVKPANWNELQGVMKRERTDDLLA